MSTLQFKSSRFMNKAVFFDRDGVLNYDSPNYVYDVESYEIYPDLPETVAYLKKKNYLLIVITNQAGLSRGIYNRDQMNACHKKLQESCENAFSKIYYSPYHPDQSKSLSRKPGTLLFEKAIAKFNIDVTSSWMIGDRDRDLIPAKKLGMKTVGVKRHNDFEFADFQINSLHELKQII